MAGKRSHDDRKGFEIDEGSFEGLGPGLYGSIEDGPGLQGVVALKGNASQVAGSTVEAVATHYPAGLDLVAIAIPFDIRDDAVVRSDGEPYQAGGMMYVATVLMQVAGEDGLCDLLGEADVEAVDAAAVSEVDGPEELAIGMDFDHALPASSSEELFDQPQGFEDLQGARVNDGCSIPVEGRGLGIDHVAGHASAAQVGGEEQTGWAGAYDEHYGLMSWPVHRAKGFQKIWGWVGVVNPVTFSRSECSGILVGIEGKDYGIDGNADMEERKTHD
jgi:hypothetical protein